MSMPIILILTLALLIVMLVVLKFNAALAFMISSIACALMAGMDFSAIGPSIVSGFGAYSGSVGFLIALGTIFSGFLERSGALEELGNWISSRFSATASVIVIMVVSFVIAIPVYFAAAVLVLAPLSMKLAKKYNQSPIAYGVAVYQGLCLGTCMVPPTPAPLAASQALGAQLGWTIIYGVFLSCISMIILVFYMRWIDKKYSVKKPAEISVERSAYVCDPTRPSPGLTFGLILLPVALILISTFTNMAIPGTTVGNFLQFIGNAHIALFITVVASMLALRKYLPDSPMKVFNDSMPDAAYLMIVLGTAGSLANVLNAIGLGQWLAEASMKLNISILVLAYVAVLLLRIGAGGSNAIIMLAAMMAPMVQQTSVSPVLVCLTLCAGPIALSFHNEAAFWMASDFWKTDSKDTMKITFWPGNICSIAMFAVIMLMQQFAHILPGLH